LAGLEHEKKFYNICPSGSLDASAEESQEEEEKGKSFPGQSVAP
jgi:hypothetical protein